MEKFFEEYLKTLESCHNNIIHAIEGLSEEALDWVPGPNMNSITVQIYHLTGAERYWIGDVVAGISSGRDREAEFQVENIGVDVLKHRLHENMDFARQALGKLSITNLAEERVSPRNEKPTTVAWALLHALEHSMLHLGHIEMTRQLREEFRKKQ